MTRCCVSEQIAAHCNEPEEIECPDCCGTMSFDGDGDLMCDDIECGHIKLLFLGEE